MPIQPGIQLASKSHSTQSTSLKVDRVAMAPYTLATKLKVDVRAREPTVSATKSIVSTFGRESRQYQRLSR